MPTADVNVNELIDALLNVNTTLIQRVITMAEKIESDLIESSGSGQLQGEVEELLRTLLQITENTLETLLSMQEYLQTRIVESYFPAQD